jgi:hypothetical protein
MQRQREEQLVQFLAARGVQRLEEVVLDPLHDRSQLVELPFAVRGQRDRGRRRSLGSRRRLDQASSSSPSSNPTSWLRSRWSVSAMVACVSGGRSARGRARCSRSRCSPRSRTPALPASDGEPEPPKQEHGARHEFAGDRACCIGVGITEYGSASYRWFRVSWKHSTIEGASE